MAHDHSPFHIDFNLNDPFLTTPTDADRIAELELTLQRRDKMIKNLEQHIEDQERAHELRIARKEGEIDAYRDLIAGGLGEMM